MNAKQLMSEAVDFLASRRNISREMLIAILNGEYGQELRKAAANQVAELIMSLK